ncbi:MAG: zinc-binding dehydrogenase [Planctomycetaceae bacterium]
MLAGSITVPHCIDLVEAPEPKLTDDGPPQIIFQPEIACLCGSDLPFFTMNGEWEPQPGHSLHEMIGTVIATNGERFRPGARVLAVPVDQVGLFERFALSEERAIPIDTRVPEEHALMAQPLGTVLFALKKLPNLVDRDVAVVGAGPMGQLFNAALRNLGARHVISIDKLPSRLEVSRRMGATAVVCNACDDPVPAVKKVLGGRLPEFVIEVVGHQDLAFNLCIDLCGHNGRILAFGVPPEIVDGVRWRDLFFRNITVHTSVNPDFRRDFPLAMQWIGDGRIDVSPLLTHRFPLAEIQTAFETFRDRKDGAIKVLVEFPSRGIGE